MRIIGIRRDGGPVVVAAQSDGGVAVTVLSGFEASWTAAPEFLAASPSGKEVPVTGVTFVPSGPRVICIGLNYLEHVAEGTHAGEGLPPYPALSARWPALLSVDDAPAPVPSNADGLDGEGEVMTRVGHALVDAGPEESPGAFVGYSTFNDLTARRAHTLTSQWILGRNGDAPSPLGPLVPTSEVGELRDGLRVRTRVNGEVVQEGRTDETTYTGGDTGSLISHTFTPRAGDLLATGTLALA